MKCCFIGCVREGEPEDGYDFYACRECCDRLEELIILEYAKADAENARS